EKGIACRLHDPAKIKKGIYGENIRIIWGALAAPTAVEDLRGLVDDATARRGICGEVSSRSALRSDRPRACDRHQPDWRCHHHQYRQLSSGSRMLVRGDCQRNIDGAKDPPIPRRFYPRSAGAPFQPLTPVANTV